MSASSASSKSSKSSAAVQHPSSRASPKLLWKDYSSRVIHVRGEGKIKEINCKAGDGTSYKYMVFEIVGFNPVGEACCIQAWGPVYASSLADFFKFRDEEKCGMGEVLLLPSEGDSTKHPSELLLRKLPEVHESLAKRNIAHAYQLKTGLSSVKGELSEQSFPIPLEWDVAAFDTEGASIPHPDTWKEAGSYSDSPEKAKRAFDFKSIQPKSLADISANKKLRFDA